MRVGDSLLTFGTTDEGWGYVQNVSCVEAMETAEAKNGQGVVKAVEVFNKGYKVTGTYTYRNEDTAVSPGGSVGENRTVTIDDPALSIYITSATKNWSQGDWESIDFDGFYWPSLGS